MDNAKKMTSFIANTLSKYDPKNTIRYQQNAKKFIKKISLLQQNKIVKKQNSSFLSMHDAYQYFEKSHNIKMSGFLYINPKSQPTISHLRELRKKIIIEDIKCIFKEPIFSSKIIKTISKNKNIKIISIDPIGASIGKSKDLYILLMKQIIEKYNICINQ
jgi:zinc transport system substrate-binding protein